MSAAAGSAQRSLVAAALGVCLLAAASGPAEAGRRDRRAKESVSGAEAGTTSGSAMGGRRWVRRAEAPRSRRLRAEPALVVLFTAPSRVSTGEELTVTVRLNATLAGGHHAALSLGVDPTVLEYEGFEPTGRGALLVQAHPDQAGALAVYRSSLPEGFAPAEDLAVLKFRVKAAGRSLLVLSEVRLLDGEARDMPVSFESSEIYFE